MKSQLRVDYKSRFGDHFAEKEPIIRVVVEKSDDPRDTLLGEIFEKDTFCKRIGVNKLSETDNKGLDVYTIFKRSDREYKINDIISPIYLALCKYSGIDAIFATGHDSMYFELADNPKVRSVGFDKSEHYLTVWHRPGYEYERELELKLIQAVVEDWKDFEKIVKDFQSKQKS